MNERGILMGAPMVRKLLTGEKTQTRRALRKQPDSHHWETLPGYELRRLEMVTIDGRISVKFVHSIPHNPNSDDASGWVTCPYGVPGTKLWVRETWRADAKFDAMSPRDIPPGSGVFCEANRGNWECGPYDGTPGKLRPSMFMPRWASRITLEVTDVRVERLHAISEDDDLAEGVTPSAGGMWTAAQGQAGTSPRAAFALLWNSINGVGSWDANPWVWCLSFRRVL